MKCDGSRVRCHGRAGFTMIEIALCLAIIGFAIVAIISALPTGLNVQKDNREETIINQDAAIWLDAIRNGARGYDDLTNFVVSITNYWTTYSSNTFVAAGVDGYVPPSSLLPAGFLANGFNIIGLLSTPKIFSPPAPGRGGDVQSNYIIAYVRSISGPAVDKAPQDNQTILDAAFEYRMIVENAAYVPFDTNSIRSTLQPGATPFDPTLADIGAMTNTEPASILPAQRPAFWEVVRENRRILGHRWLNSRDLRLTFRWPVLPTGEPGNGRHTFRVFTMARLFSTNSPMGQSFQPLFFLEPPLPRSLTELP